MSAGNDGARGDARKRRVPQPDPDGGITGVATRVALTEDECESLFTAGDHHPDHCDCSAYAIEQAFASDCCCEGLLDTIAATERIVAERLRQVEAERDKRHGCWAQAVKQAHAAEVRAEQAEAALAEARQREERVRALGVEWAADADEDEQWLNGPRVGASEAQELPATIRIQRLMVRQLGTALDGGDDA